MPSRPGFSLKTIALEVGREFQGTEPIVLSVGGVDEVVSVIASGRPQQADEVAKAISLITNEELSKRNAYTLSEGVSICGPSASINSVPFLLEAGLGLLF